MNLWKESKAKVLMLSEIILRAGVTLGFMVFAPDFLFRMSHITLTGSSILFLLFTHLIIFIIEWGFMFIPCFFIKKYLLKSRHILWEFVIIIFCTSICGATIKAIGSQPNIYIFFAFLASTNLLRINPSIANEKSQKAQMPFGFSLLKPKGQQSYKDVVKALKNFLHELNEKHPLLFRKDELYKATKNYIKKNKREIAMRLSQGETPRQLALFAASDTIQNNIFDGSGILYTGRPGLLSFKGRNLRNVFYHIQETLYEEGFISKEERSENTKWLDGYV